MQTRDYSWFPLTLLWFGAAMSVAEIYTGGLSAAAGSGGIPAIVAGHLVGVFLLGLMGYLGYREGMPSIMCTRIAFGRRGSWVLSLANLMQLLGWTTVMLQQNAQAVGGITKTLWGIEATTIAVIIMGCLIALWAFWESQGNHSGNTIAVILLGLLGLVVTYVLWQKAGTSVRPAPPVTMSFSEAFELSLIMPLSWVPLVADYASRAKSAKTACLAPALGYFVGSVWMYLVGFFGAMLTGEASPTPMLLAAGLGIIALCVVVFSTIVTTFLDVYSAVASAKNIWPNLPDKAFGLAVVVIGTSAALIWDSELYMYFLSCIGAVFAPLSAILFTDYFLLRKDMREQSVSYPSFISLGCGVAAHVGFSIYGSPMGPTLSCLLLTLVVHIGVRKCVVVKTAS